MSFFAELKRRNVYRAAAFYAAAGWLLVQVATQVFPFFHIDEWVVRWIVIAVVIGFPFALLISWFYEWTPQGIKRESEVDRSESIMYATGKKLDRWIIATLGVAVVLLLTDKFVLRKDAISTTDKSIAVLPLVNESGDPDQQYFSDGLSEDIITALSQFRSLKVIGRNSSFQFRDTKDDAKAIGGKLGVANLLEGSVRRAGEIVRVSAELIRAADGSTVWSQRYDRPYKDLFALQDEITQSVAAALKAKLLSSSAAAQDDRPPSGSLDAYTAYLQGQFYRPRNTPEDEQKAVEQFVLATRLDPKYAHAWAWLSRTQTGIANNYLGGAEAQKTYAAARAAAETALRLAPDLAMAHSARGYVLGSTDFEWREAETEYRRAVELAPEDGEAKYGLGSLRATFGQLESAIALTRQALLTDPLNTRWLDWLSNYLCGAGRLDEAAASIHKAIDLRPGAVHYHTQLTYVEIARGDAAAALAAASQEPPGTWRATALALASQIGPDRAAADAALQNLIDKQADGSAYQIADVYALRRDADNTFAWLDRAWTNRDPGVGTILFDPLILRYQNDPRFAAFCQKIGLPTTTEGKGLP